MTLSKRQLMQRMSGIGASEVAAVVGEDPWTPPIDIWRRKIAGEEGESGGSLAAELGDLMEEPICRLYARRTGLHLVQCSTFRHPEYDYALATPDRAAFLTRSSWPDPRKKIREVAELRETDRLVQAKHSQVRFEKEFGNEGTDDVPTRFIIQTTWEMGVTGMRQVDLPVLFDKSRLGQWRIMWNEELWGSLLELVGRFWRDHVVAGVPPPPDASDAYRDWLYTRHPTFRREGKRGSLAPVVPGCELDDKVRLWGMAKAFRALLEAPVDQLGNEIRAAIGDDYGLRGEWGQVAWIRSPGKPKVDWFLVASELKLLTGQILNALEGVTEESNGDLYRLLLQAKSTLSGVEASATKPAKEYAQLRSTWTDGRKGELRDQAIDFLRALGLPALPAGENTTTTKDEEE